MRLALAGREQIPGHPWERRHPVGQVTAGNLPRERYLALTLPPSAGPATSQDDHGVPVESTVAPANTHPAYNGSIMDGETLAIHGGPKVKTTPFGKGRRFGGLWF